MNRCQACEPSGGVGRGARRGRRRADAANALAVAAGERAAGLEQLLGPVQLDEPERGGDVGHVVLVARRPRSRSTTSRRPCSGSRRPADAVERHEAGPVGDGVVVGDEHPALARRDRLGRVERVGAGAARRSRPSDRPDRRPGSGTRGRCPRRPGCPRGVELADELLDLHRTPGDVDDDDGLRPRRDGGAGSPRASR